MRRLGAEVTVVERNKRLLKNENKDIVNVLIEVLKNEGVRVYTSTTIIEVSGKSESSVTLKGTPSGELAELSGSHIFCATCRLPNNENIGPERLALRLHTRELSKLMKIFIPQATGFSL